MCSKVLNGHIILTDTSITTILAPEMTYTPKFVSLQLESMPSDGQKVRGTFTDNTGLNIGSIEDFVLLKSDKQHYWFWSDQTRVGFVFPRIGM